MTGEVVMGIYVKTRWGHHQLTDVKQCIVSVAEGRMEVNLADYIPFAKEYNFTFNKDHVVNVFEAKPQLEQNYKIATGNQRGK
jgi:hypothetical protein